MCKSGHVSAKATPKSSPRVSRDFRQQQQHKIPQSNASTNNS